MSDDENKENTMQIFSSLAHPIRRKILELIDEYGEISYTELLNLTDQKSGPLYHHLRKIDFLFFQTEDKKYRLNEEGKKAVYLIQTGIEKQNFIDTEEKEDKISFFGISFFPIISLFSRNPFRSFFEFVLLLSIFGYFSAINNLLVLGNFIVSYETSLFLTNLYLFLSWLFLGVVTELLARLLYKKTANSFTLFVVSAVSFFPLIIVFIFVWSMTYLIPEYTLSSTASLILHGLFQIWTFLVLTTALIKLKELSLEKAAIVALIVNYTFVTIMIFTLIPK